MNLHRSGKHPEWQNVPNKSKNIWQKIAQATNGWLTPPNIITFAGFGLVLFGLYEILNERYLSGMILVLVGRLADILDGWLADLTSTKSPLGELLDATIDKIGTVLTFLALFAVQITAWPILLFMLLPQLLNSLLILYGLKTRVRWHPSKAGKLSMALLWTALIGLLSLEAFSINNTFASVIMDALGLASGLIGFYVSYEYFKQAFIK